MIGLAERGRSLTLTTPSRARHLPGEEGTWVFIFGDITLFAVLFCLYLHDRGAQTGVFEASQDQLNVNLGALNTVMLLISSLLVVTALRAMRQDEPLLARRLLYGTMLCGVVFMGDKAFEYSQKISHDSVPATNDFFMYFYVMTGLHLLHVLMGMGLLTFAVRLTRHTTLTGRRLAAFEGIACFWHMVDLLWIVIFPLVYLVK